MAEGGWVGGRGARRGNHIKFPCYIRHLYGNSMDMHLLDFKRKRWKSVNFDNLFRNKMFGLQLFVHIESVIIHVSGIRPW